ncbi:hypothetical protein BISA_1647 [Bifidobacterium saguini DSM 23967]|uniref:Uncharacterized protein n=3 Tax=Bifidobacterium TaxID=1678 RepID=A0A2N5ISJ5_9BIFI|nr:MULTISPECIES: hypothetical protein [Bifidobacterium]KFI93825.1 hypothetical protein BISA_1647 [Bifidobacterium saguini DSM 23967]PLS24907.1 hypothetical protein Tam1G_1046 [Bifidobacterium imperatoris]QSY56854.1 hypothetical protein BLI708_06095 [Bifidobacterium imperatoris]QTB91565.1 hypothetical protein BSD967_03900 [Bifidobacterium saguini]
MASIYETQLAAAKISHNSKQLQTLMATNREKIDRNTVQLAAVTRGSIPGQRATREVQQASAAMKKAISMLEELQNETARYIKESRGA